MSELKCPFCGEKLYRYYIDPKIPFYICDNQKCKIGKRGHIATMDLWQELIRTRKALDVAVDALDAGRTLARIAGFEMLATGMEEAVKQITALEQKDVK